MKGATVAIKGFPKYFNVRDTFLDEISSVLSGKYQLDIIAFDDWLIKEHNYDIDVHGSAKDFVTDKFGKGACAFIESLLG